MKVLNIHERALEATSQQVGALVDSLASPRDALWPRHTWPPMKFDRPLGVGAKGGHGPVRYFVEEYTPGRSVRFRFTGPRGFDGYHGCEVIETEERAVVLRHTLQIEKRGPALVSWPLIFGPLHDALLEDALAQAQASLGQEPQVRRWSPWVRFLRWSLTGGKARPQVMPEKRTPEKHTPEKHA